MAHFGRRRKLGASALVISCICLVLASSEARGQRQPSSCVSCHASQRDPRLREPAQQLEASVHGQVALDCHHCHGGRPDEPSVRAHDRRAGFRPGFGLGDEPSVTFGVCGSCHASAEPSREPSNAAPALDSALAGYLRSGHAAASSRGKAGATCADCHGAHDVRPTADHQSSVHRARVAQTCARCHGDPATAASAPAETVLQRWQQSVHGQLFAIQQEHGARTGKRTERAAPTCIDCHGGHAIGAPGLAVAGCERCHAPIWGAFSASPHAAAFERRGFLPCVDCHGSHAIDGAGPELLGRGPGGACRRCHLAGGEVTETIDSISSVAAAAEAQVSEALQQSLSAQARDELVGLRASLRLAVHGLDADQVRSAAQALSAHASGPLQTVKAADVRTTATRRQQLEGPLQVVRAPERLGYVLLFLGAGLLWLAVRRIRPGRRP